MKESGEEKAVGQFCKDHGITFQKQGGQGDRGKSDRICMKQGIAAFVELKRRGQVPTKLQLRYLEGRSADGFHAAWFDNAPAAIKWLKEVFNV